MNVYPNTSTTRKVVAVSRISSYAYEDTEKTRRWHRVTITSEIFRSVLSVSRIPSDTLPEFFRNFCHFRKTMTFDRTFRKKGRNDYFVYSCSDFRFVDRFDNNSYLPTFHAQREARWVGKRFIYKLTIFVQTRKFFFLRKTILFGSGTEFG